jgi:DNA-binding protein H-NS
MATDKALQSIEAQIAKLQAKADKVRQAAADDQARKAQMAAVIGGLVTQLNENRISLADLKAHGYAFAGRGGPVRSGSYRAKSPGTDKRSTVAAKYRDPANSANTWTGRGKAPRWLSAYLAAGKSKQDFAI